MGRAGSAVVQHLARDAKTFERLRHTAIDAHHMDDRANLFRADTVVQGPPTMGFPFVHLAQGTDHREVHHRPRLGLDHVIAPAKAPAPGGHRLLKRAGEVIGGGEVLFHVVGEPNSRGFATGSSWRTVFRRPTP